MYNIDSYYEIGTSHIVCEDHSIHGEHEGLQYIIGADGCSSSSGVDLGAGLLCHIAKKQIIELGLGIFDSALSSQEEILRTRIVQNCFALRESLKLNPHAFDATLWIAVAYKEKIFVFGWGDGVLVIKKQNQNDIQIIEREYDSGAPYYLSYWMDMQRKKDYLENLSGDKGLFRYYVNEIFYEQGEEKEFQQLNVTAPFIKEFNKGEIDFITICSDGIKTFQQIENGNIKPINICTIVPELVDYESTRGKFVERKMLKLRKAHRQNNIVHLDDLFCITMSEKEPLNVN